MPQISRFLGLRAFVESLVGFVGDESPETAEAADTRSIAVELQSLDKAETPHLFIAMCSPNRCRSKGARDLDQL